MSVIVVSISSQPEGSKPPRWVRRLLMGNLAKAMRVKVYPTPDKNNMPDDENVNIPIRGGSLVCVCRGVHFA